MGISMFHRSITSMQNQTPLWYCTATCCPTLFAVLTMLSHSLPDSQTWNVHLNPLGDLAKCRFWIYTPARDPDEHKTLNGSYQWTDAGGPWTPLWIARLYLSLAISWHHAVWPSFFCGKWGQPLCEHFFQYTPPREREIAGKN